MDGEGPLEVSSPSPCSKQTPQVVQGVSRLVLNTSMDGDPTTSVGSLQLELTLLHLCRDVFLRSVLSQRYFFVQ